MSFKQWLESAVRQGTSRWVDPAPIGLAARRRSRAQRRGVMTQVWRGLEPLENRVMLSAVHWIGPDGGLWSDAANWAGGTGVPTASDDVTINLGSKPTVNFTSAAGNVTIQSLTCSDPLNITGGSLTITGAGSTKASQTTDALTITGGTLTVTGSGTTFTASGATTGIISNANLVAQNGAVESFSDITGLVNVNLTAASGGQLLFPMATSYASSDNAIQANGSSGGVGSRINLSALGTFTNNYATTVVSVSTGGEIDLSGQVSGSAQLTLSDTASELNVAAVTKLTDLSVTATGGTLNFAGVTTLTGVNLTAASGGQLLFPMATSYASSDNAIQANGSSGGVGSRINLSALGTFTNNYATTVVSVSTGGEIDLSGQVSGSAQLTLSDTASELNVAAVTKLTDLSVTATGGTLNFAGVTTLTGVNLTAASGGQLLFPMATSYASSDNAIQANGSSGGVGSRINLSALGTFTNNYATTVVSVSTGGEIDLSGQVSGSAQLTLSDTASELNVAAVTKLTDLSVTATGGTLNFAGVTTLTGVNLTAASGGQLLFPMATSYASSDNAIQANGSSGGVGSRINLSALGTFTNNYATTVVSVSTGGEIDLSGQVSGSAQLTLSDTASELNVAAVTKLTDLSVTATGGTLNFAGVTTLTGVNLTAASGGQLLFPMATSYASSDNAIQANGSSGGVGSRINLSALGTFTNNYATTVVSVSTGGEIDLSGQVSGSAQLTLSDTASELDLGGVTKFTNTAINISNNATLTFPSASAITWAGSDAITATTGGSLVNSGTFSTDGVTLNLTGSSLTNQPGGTITGSGTINGDLINNGTVSPGGDGAADKLTVNGNYTQSSAATLRIEIGGNTPGTQYDYLSVTGTGNKASLAGTEDVHLINGFTPANGKNFTTVLGSSVVGMFATINGLSPGGGVTLSPQYESSEHFLTASVTPVSDTTPPTVGPLTIVGSPAAGAASIDFTLQYTDDVAIQASTIDTNDLAITGGLIPFTGSVASVSIDTPGNGSPRTATYHVTNPGGFVGTYSVALKAGAVIDTSGNAAAAGTVGSFTLAAPTTVSLGLSANPVASGQSETLTATVTANDGTPGGTATFFDGSSSLGAATLNAGGVATLTISDLSAGDHSLTAHYGGVTDYTPGDSTLRVLTVTPTASRVVFTQPPLDATAGDHLNVIQISIEDQSGDVVVGDTSEVTLDIAGSPPGVTLGGTLTEPVLDGVATFSDLSLTKADSYTLIATDGLLAPDTSAPFTINPGPPAQVAIVQQPTVTTAGQAVSPFVVAVDVEDAFGNLVTTDGSAVTLSFTGGITHDAVMAAAIGGEAVFSLPSVTPKSTYTLSAADGGLLTATSTNILAANVTKSSTTIADPKTNVPLATFTLTGGGSAQVTVAHDESNPIFDVSIPSTGKNSTFTVTPPSKAAAAAGTPILLRDITIGDAVADAPSLSTVQPLALWPLAHQAASSSVGEVQLKSFTATNGTLVGTFEVAGTLQTLTIGQVSGGAIKIDAPPSGIAVTPLVLNIPLDIENSSIDSAIPIKSLTTVAWIDDDATPDYLKAPSIGTITATGKKNILIGDFQANVAGEDDADGNPTATTLGSAKIAGALTGVTWNLTGVTNSIQVGGDLGDADNAVTINAVSIKSFKVGGDLDHAMINLSQAIVAGSPKTTALGSLIVGGTLKNSTVASAGIVSAVTLGAMDNSQLLVGDGGTPGLVSDPNTFTSQPNVPNLISFTIKGLVADQSSLTDSVIDAWNIGKASLKLVGDAGAAAAPFGFAADKIASLTFQNSGVSNGKPVTLKNLDTTEPLDEELADPKRDPALIDLSSLTGGFTLHVV